MDAELMDRMELAARVQASSKRVEEAAVELAMACEAPSARPEAGKGMSCGEAVYG